MFLPTAHAPSRIQAKDLESRGIADLLSEMSVYAGKPFVVFFDEVVRYIDHLGQSEGWLVVFDPDLTKPWEDKIGLEKVTWKGRPVHVVRC